MPPQGHASEVNAYSVKMRALGKDAWHYFNSAEGILVSRGGDPVQAPATQCIVKKLWLDQFYEASVSAKTASGWGPWSSISKPMSTTVCAPYVPLESYVAGACMIVVLSLLARLALGCSCSWLRRMISHRACCWRSQLNLVKV